MISATSATGKPLRDRRIVLAMLVLVYMVNFIDRQIVGILAGPIKADLGLTDTQLGLMGGLAFALFYSGFGIPAARLADRTSRTAVMTAALALWSLFTAACGLAAQFWQLFLCRMGVGIGEAGGVAPSYALISGYFPREQRARALAIYSLAIPAGSALGIFFGGWIAVTVNWRAAFLIAGALGLLLALPFRLIVREPARAAPDADGNAADNAIIRSLLKNSCFLALSFGAAACSVIGYGMLFWAPSFFMRSFHLSLLDAAHAFGAIILIGGSTGIYAGGVLGDWLGEKRKAAYALIPAAAHLVSLSLYAAGLSAPSLSLAFPAFLIGQAIHSMWLGPVTAAIQHLAPAARRATASALFLFIINLIGLGLGTVFFGIASDAYRLRFGEEALRYALLTGLAFYPIASGLFFFASKRLERRWLD